MRLRHGRVFGIVAIQAQRRGRFGQVISKFGIRARARFVRDVAGFAPHVQRRVMASLGKPLLTLRVALRAQVFFLPAGSRFHQLELVIGLVRIVALQTIADRRAVDQTFRRGRVLVGMALKAEFDGCDGGEFDAGDVFTNAEFMTAQTAHCDGGVHRFSLGLVFVAFEAFLGIGVFVEWNGMRRPHRQCGGH